MHNPVEVNVDQRQKCQIHLINDDTKESMDAVDLFSTNHSTRIQSKGRLINVFVFVLH